MARRRASTADPSIDERGGAPRSRATAQAGFVSLNAGSGREKATRGKAGLCISVPTEGLAFAWDGEQWATPLPAGPHEPKSKNEIDYGLYIKAARARQSGRKSASGRPVTAPCGAGEWKVPAPSGCAARTRLAALPSPPQPPQEPRSRFTHAHLNPLEDHVEDPLEDP